MFGVFRTRLAACRAAFPASAALAMTMSRQKADCSEKWVPPKVWLPVESGGKWAAINRATAGARTEGELKVGTHPIQLYATDTPNGFKITILLEEICEAVPGFDYDAWNTSISGDQFTTGFVAINPNSKIPTVVDRTTSPPTRVFESGSILLYIAERYPEANLLPKEPAKRTEAINWLMWQMAQGPLLGNGFGHFYNYAPEPMEYPINRFTMEVKRQLDVLDQQLAKNRYIAGDQYTVADIACWPWYGALVLGRLYGSAAEFLSVSEYKNVLRWAKELEEQRPAVRRGRMVYRTKRQTIPLYKDHPFLFERHSRDDWAKAAASMEPSKP